MYTCEQVALRWAPPSAGEARHIMVRALRDAGAGQPAIDDAILILTELISNALRHARPPVSGELRVGWLLQGSTLRISVVDGGSEQQPAVLSAREDSLGGRGLAMIEALCLGWGAESDDGSNTVWADLGMTSRRSAHSAPVTRSA